MKILLSQLKKKSENWEIILQNTYDEVLISKLAKYPWNFQRIKEKKKIVAQRSEQPPHKRRHRNSMLAYESQPNIFCH